MRTIYKYKVNLSAKPIYIPQGATLCFVGLSPDDQSVAMWFDIPDIDAPSDARRFVILGTGHPVSSSEKYIGSVIDGTFVWHVFEKGE